MSTVLAKHILFEWLLSRPTFSVVEVSHRLISNEVMVEKLKKTVILPYVPKSCASYKCHNFRSICPTQKIRYVLSSSQQYLSFEMTYEEIGAFLTDLKIFDF